MNGTNLDGFIYLWMQQKKNIAPTFTYHLSYKVQHHIIHPFTIIAFCLYCRADWYALQNFFLNRLLNDVKKQLRLDHYSQKLCHFALQKNMSAAVTMKGSMINRCN